MGSGTKARLTITLVVAVAMAGLATFALAASGGEGADDGVFRVTMTDGAIELESAQTEPGAQVIEWTNEGGTEHELVAVRTDFAADKLPVGLEGVSVSQAGEILVGEDHLDSRHKHEPGSVLGLLPGESQRQQVELLPGRYVFFCQTGLHYQDGERTTLTVR